MFAEDRHAGNAITTGGVEVLPAWVTLGEGERVGALTRFFNAAAPPVRLALVCRMLLDAMGMTDPAQDPEPILGG